MLLLPSFHALPSTPSTPSTPSRPGPAHQPFWSSVLPSCDDNFTRILLGHPVQGGRQQISRRLNSSVYMSYMSVYYCHWESDHPVLPFPDSIQGGLTPVLIASFGSADTSYEMVQPLLKVRE
jgi:hypothetical protein